MRSALKTVKGVSKVEVGPKTGTNATTTVTAKKDVKVDELIKVLKAKGYGATEKTEKEEA